MTFENDVEPDGVLEKLSAEIKADPKSRQSTRIGQFDRIIVFCWHYNRTGAGDTVQPIRQYLFFVIGFMKSVTWIADILGRHGTVSFPVGEDEWDFPFGEDIRGADNKNAVGR